MPATRLAGAAEEIGIAVQHRDAAERRHHRGIAWHEAAHGNALPGQRRGQRAHNIGKAAGLHQREDFRRQPRGPSCSEAVDHRLGDEADAAFGAAEALGIEFRIFADHESFGMSTPLSITTFLS